MTRDEQEPKATESGATDASNGHGGAGSSAGHQGAPRVVEHFSVAERAARGKAARAEVTRASHGDWEPALHRPDPVELLEEQAQTRVPELVPIRYGRMLVSPFTFYRGAAYLMASDLASGPRTGLYTQLCGDAHLSNFGGFAAPDRQIVFSINDFDETLPGPFEWDVKRLVASFAVAGRDRGFDEKQREAVNLMVGRAYREGIRKYSAMRNLDIWYSRLDVDELLAELRRLAKAKDAKVLERGDANVAKGRTKDSMKAFGKLTGVIDGQLRIVGDPPLITPIEDVHAGMEADQIEEFLRLVIRSYRRTLAGDRRKLLERFRYVHAARKVVGVGSVGTRAWICLMLGRDDEDPLFLQFKEAQPSVLEPFLGRSEFANSGQRVVEGQRLTQAASDIMLGWIKVDAPDGVKRDFYVRQLWDGKMSALVDVMEPRTMVAYARVCGTELAARTRGQATASRSPATSAKARPSTAPWPASRKPTPTKTSATTRRSRTQSRRDSSRPKPVCRGHSDIRTGTGAVLVASTAYTGVAADAVRVVEAGMGAWRPPNTRPGRERAYVDKTGFALNNSSAPGDKAGMLATRRRRGGTQTSLRRSRHHLKQRAVASRRPQQTG